MRGHPAGAGLFEQQTPRVWAVAWKGGLPDRCEGFNLMPNIRNRQGLTF